MTKNNSSQIIQRFSNVARSIFSSIENQNSSREPFEKLSRAQIRGLKTACLAISFGIIAFCALSINRIIDWPPGVYSDPRVLNLTRSDAKWQTTVFESKNPTAKFPGNLAGDKVSYEALEVLPTQVRQFEIPDGSFIKYEIRLRLADQFSGVTEPIYINSMFIWAKKYWVFFNEVLVDSGTNGPLFSPLLNVVQNDNGVQSLKIIVEPGTAAFKGILNSGDVVIGPKSLLEGLVLRTHELATTFFLWFLLPKLSFCLLFAFVFLSVGKHKEYFSFVICAFFGALRLYYSSTYAESLPWIANIDLARIASVMEFWFLAKFINDYFRRDSTIFSKYYARITCALIALFAMSIPFVENDEYSALIGYIWKTARATTYVYGAYISGATFFFLRNRKLSRSRQNSSIIMALFFTFAFSFFVLDMSRALPVALRAALPAISDLVFLVFLSVTIAIEFGNTMRQRDSASSTVYKFLDKKIANQYLNNSTKKVVNTALAERKVTILFSDMRSFSKITEKYPMSEVVVFLSQYLETMTDVVTQFGGTIDKFGGDSIMAVWGAPISTGADADNAVSAALEMRRRLLHFNAQRMVDGKFQVAIGVGVHTGMAIAGEVGSKDRVEYTVIGDSVNTASRIEGLTKELQTDILISDATYEEVKKRALVASCGSMTPRGKTHALGVYKLIGLFDEAGVCQMYDSTYESHLSTPMAPGIVDENVSNLQWYDYSANGDINAVVAASSNDQESKYDIAN